MIALNCFTIVFLLSVIFSLRLIPRTAIDVFEKKDTTCLRGILAVIIVFSHIATDGMGWFSYFAYSGFTCVALFFFMSGLGLTRKYFSCGSSYVNSIPQNKILYFTILFVLTNVLAFLESRYLLHCPLSSITSSFPFAGNTWYLVVQICMYATFYLSAKLSRESRKRFYIVSVVLLLSLSIICYRIGLIYLYYSLYFTFSVGMLAADEHILKKMFRLNFSNLLIFFILFVLFILPQFLLPEYKYEFRTLSAPFMICILCSLFTRFRFNGRVWEFLGDMSLEIYLVHGFVFVLLRPIIADNLLYIIATLSITILISLPVHKMNCWIYGVIKQ